MWCRKKELIRNLKPRSVAKNFSCYALAPVFKTLIDTRPENNIVHSEEKNNAYIDLIDSDLLTGSARVYEAKVILRT